MGNAFKCDRCNHFEDGSPAQSVTLTPETVVPMGTSQNQTTKHELCAKCIMSLTDWLDHYKRDQSGAGA